MASIALNQELPEEFLSDILITAFDGQYGSSWAWFEPACDAWLGTKTAPSGYEDSTGAMALWMEVKCRLQEDYPTGFPLFDTREGFTIDHNSVAHGLSRIINDDYLGVWREPTEAEMKHILGLYGSGAREGVVYERKFKNQYPEAPTWQIETGETARTHRSHITRCVLNAINGVDEGVDIDANDADVIIQAAAFGKVIFS